ncbi:hypothetical protein HYALB_00011439 [Hymenoscyphus albidus]|uniref:NAD(P)-binding protein n=1 Tax=Hymenoscyphus albidus TaxID=595503 RepID=A0A9N9LTL0_9HELO|nr:hypothetical protein HYALB_00011439 [Hymenoscyphus albidus]
MPPSRSVIITGGTAGLGLFAAREIAKAHPEYLVVLASRNDGDGAADKINAGLQQENTVYVPLDLSDNASVRKFAEKWASKNHPPIQALLLNAGLQFPGALQKNFEGLEKTFVISHIGHALLFHLLCPYFAPNIRVVVTSSGTHDPAKKTGLPDAVYHSAEELAHPPTSAVKIPGRQRYSTTKLANVLWTYALNSRLVRRVPERGITINAFDPGLMPGTGLARVAVWYQRILWFYVLPYIMPLLKLLIPNVHTAEESGHSLARLAVGKEVEGVSGRYFEGSREIKSSNDSYDESKQEDLWTWTIDYLSNGSDSDKARFESFA